MGHHVAENYHLAYRAQGDAFTPRPKPTKSRFFLWDCRQRKVAESSRKQQPGDFLFAPSTWPVPPYCAQQARDDIAQSQGCLCFDVPLFPQNGPSLLAWIPFRRLLRVVFAEPRFLRRLLWVSDVINDFTVWRKHSISALWRSAGERCAKKIIPCLKVIPSRYKPL